MHEEYMSAQEITREIADLKIRLALQQEFEAEVEKLIDECKMPDERQLQSIRQMEEKVLKNITQFTSRRKPRTKHGHILPWRLRIVAMVMLLLLVSAGSCLATVHMIQIGLLKLDVRTYTERTSYGLVPSGEKVDVPEEWTGDFYPTYIPKEYIFDSCYSNNVLYLNANGGSLSFSEEVYGSRTSLDTENASISSVLINGAEATLIEKDGWTAVVWTANNRLFIVDIDGTKEDALRVAASVILIK